MEFKIQHILSKISESDLKRSELNYLIDKSYRKAIAILKSKYNHYFSYKELNGEKLENIAIDSIVPLFVSEGTGKYGIIRSIKNWKHSIDTETESEYFLFNVISRRVEHTVTNYLKEKDPVFEKILNTLNVCISNNDFKKVKYFGSIYVLDENVPKITGKVISPDEFDMIPDSYFKLKQKHLFNKIFEYLKKEGNYCAAVPLNELVSRVKLFHSSEQFKSAGNNKYLDTNFIFNELVEIALESVKNKLESHYVSSDILSHSESSMIFNAFQNISDDMLNIGAYDTLYKYLKDYDDSITKEVYYLKYRNIMKYLLMELKLKIGQNLEN